MHIHTPIHARVYTHVHTQLASSATNKVHAKDNATPVLVRTVTALHIGIADGV